MKKAALLLTVALFLGACAPKPKNLVLITMDTTRADRLGCYGYDAHTPYIDKVARESSLFRRAFAVTPITGPSHASILTGMYPPFHQMRDNGKTILPEELVSLAEIFRAADYRTAAFVAAYPVIGKFGFSQGFDEFSDHFDAGLGEVFVTNLPSAGVSRRPGDVVAREFNAWLDSHHEKPFFVWVHFYDAHKPIDSPEDFISLFPDSPYDGEVAFMDDCIGSVLKGLQRHEIEERTGVILVADHGEGLGDHGEETHALLSFNSTLNVPMILSMPWMKQANEISEYVSIVDIAPTVVDAWKLGENAEIPAFQGISLLPLIKGEPSPGKRRLYFECFLPYFSFKWYPTRGIIDGRNKLIEGPQSSVWDLDEDFEEIREIRDPELRRRLEKELLEFVPHLEEHRPPLRESSISNETIEELQALGYTASHTTTEPSQLSPEELSKLPDPRSNLDVWENFNDANNMARTGNWSKCIELCQKLLKNEPGNLSATLLLARAKTAIEDFSAADALYENVLQHFRGPDALTQAAFYYLRVKKTPEKAVECMDLLLAQWPKDVDAITLRAEAKLMLGDASSAEKGLRQALQIRPDALDALLQLGGLLDSRDKKHEEAGNLFNSAVKHHPFSPEAHFSLGVFELRQGRTGEALRHFTKASSYSRSGVFDQAHLALAMIARDQGDTSREQRYLEELLRATHDTGVHRQAKALLDELTLNSPRFPS